MPSMNRTCARGLGSAVRFSIDGASKLLDLVRDSPRTAAALPANDSLMREPLREAKRELTEVGSFPGRAGFVLNARDASWVRSGERGQHSDFERRQEWTLLGSRIRVLTPAGGMACTTASGSHASVDLETSKPGQVYARLGAEKRTADAEGWLPTLDAPSAS